MPLSRQPGGLYSIPGSFKQVHELTPSASISGSTQGVTCGAMYRPTSWRRSDSRWATTSWVNRPSPASGRGMRVCAT